MLQVDHQKAAAVALFAVALTMMMEFPLDQTLWKSKEDSWWMMAPAVRMDLLMEQMDLDLYLPWRFPLHSYYCCLESQRDPDVAAVPEIVTVVVALVDSSSSLR